MNKPDIIVNMLTYSRISDKTKINRMIVTVKKPLRIYGAKQPYFFLDERESLTNMQFIYTPI